MTERLNNSADTDMPQNGDAGHLRAKASVDESKEESQPLLAAFAVLIFWLFLRVASFNFPGLLIVPPLLLLLFVFLLVKGLVRREIRRELARISAKS